MASSTAELWEYRALVVNLTQRQLKSEYKRSLLGSAWSLLNPIVNLAVLSVVFGVFLNFGRNVPPIGDSDLKSFPLYLFCGLIMYGQFKRTSAGAMGALRSNAGLLRKVYFPADAPILAHAIVQVRQALIEGAILTALLLALGYGSWTVLLFPLLLPSMFAFALGVGYVLALLAAYYGDVQYLVEHLMQLLFYATPILYPLDRVGDSEILGVSATTLLTLNPLTQYVGAARDLLYIQQIPSAGRILALILLPVASLLIGYNVFRIFGRDVTEEL
jgi:ABC-type polysaccharide/polyol phosphate export permease